MFIILIHSDTNYFIQHFFDAVNIKGREDDRFKKMNNFVMLYFFCIILDDRVWNIIKSLKNLYL